MRMRVGVILAAAVLFQGSHAISADGPWTLQVAGGYARPIDRSLDVLFLPGFEGHVAVERPLVSSLSAVAAVGLSRFPFDPDHGIRYSSRSGSGQLIIDQPATVFAGTLSAKATLGDTKKRIPLPWIAVGAGIARVAYDFETRERLSLGNLLERRVRKRDVAPVLTAAIGAHMRLHGRLGVNAAWTYHQAFTERQGLLIVAYTINHVRYTTLHLGATYTAEGWR